MSAVADLLANAGGTPSAFNKESPIGAVVKGTIVSTDVRHKRSYETGEPKFWDNGDPQQQVVIIIQTDLRNPEIEDDDGRRGIYIKWWGDDRVELIRAVKAAGDTDVRVGGRFAAKFASEKPNSNTKLNDAKIFQYWYQKPATGLDFGGEQVDQRTGEIAPQAQQQPQQTAAFQPPATTPGMTGGFPSVSEQAAAANLTQQLGATPITAEQWAAGGQPAPQAQPAPQTLPAGAVDVEKIKQLLALGLNDGQIADAAGASMEVVAALRALP